MKPHEKTLTGRITSEGKLALYSGELKEFTSMWRNTRVTVTFKVYNPGTSAALKGYYYNYVVPSFKKAIWESGERKTDEQTERYLRELSPVMYSQIADEETGKYYTEIREIKDLDNSEMIEYLENLKQIAAEEFNIFIDDPKTI